MKLLYSIEVRYIINITYTVSNLSLKIIFFFADLNSEELVAKRANAERIKEFSKNLKAYNKDTITKLKAEQDMYGDADDKKQQMSSRDKAIAFAKNIPKPKVKTPSNDLGNKNGMAMGNNVGVEVEPVNELDELELKHLQSRKQVEAIKRSLGL